MVEALLSGGNTTLKVLVAAIAVVVLLAVAFWVLRRFGSGRLRRAAARGRQPRLGVIDSAPVDGRRRLLLIRRDNVEHLVMIGGPTDVVVEQNIVRAAPTREAAPARPAAAADTLPRPAPLAEATLWPLQPEPAAKAEPSLRVEPRVETPRPEAPRPEAPIVPARERRTRATDALAGLAEELSRVAPTGESGGTGERSIPRRAVRPQPTSGEGQAKSSPDQNLTEMAQRLEAAVGRPPRSLEKGPEKSEGARPADAASKPVSEIVAQAAPAEPAAPPAHAASAAPVAPQKSAYDNLEEEMASLLGRAPGKP